MFKKLIVSKALRRRVNWIIAAILILPFVLFFHSSLQSPVNGVGGIAGELFGKPVSWETFERELQWVRNQWQNRLGDLPGDLNRLLIPSAWERLMLLAEAKRLRLRVSDEALAEFIQQLPPFQENGRFVPERYRRYLAAIGTSPQAFEDSLRHDLLIEQLLKSQQPDIPVTDREILNTYLQVQERVRVSMLRVDPATLHETVSGAITEEELRGHFDRHQEEWRHPDQVTFEYLGRTREETRPMTDVAEYKITAYYEEHRDEFREPGGPPPPLSAIREQIIERLQNKEIDQRLNILAIDLEAGLRDELSLEALAKRNLLEVRTIGPVPIGSRFLVDGPEAAVVEAAFALAAEPVSDVVETDNGVYVVRLVRRDPSRLPTLEEVRPSVVELLTAEKAREAAKTRAETLRDQVQQQLDDGIAFEAACQTLGVAPTSPTPFTRTEPIEDVGHVPAVNAAAFAVSSGQLTEVIETPAGFVFLLAHERLAADAAGLTEAERARLREALVNERRQARLAEWVEEVRSRANLKSYVESREDG